MSMRILKRPTIKNKTLMWESKREQGQQLQGVGKKPGVKAKRTLAPDNVKRSDIAPWDRNDKKVSWQAWKMATRRMLKDSNIS